MPTIAENQLIHPNWFADPTTLDADVAQFLAWQGAQPGAFHPTIADDWAVAGTGPLYNPNVLLARQALDRHAAAVFECRATGQQPPDAPWERWTPGVVAAAQTTGIAASEGGPTFGGR